MKTESIRIVANIRHETETIASTKTKVDLHPFSNTYKLLDFSKI